jgi:hypothetical protein
MMIRDEQGWAIDSITPDATHENDRRQRYVELSINSESELEVRFEAGSGYTTQVCTTAIPKYILVGLLERAGATVTWQPPVVLPGDYEQCGTCGFDHAYEYEEAVQAHNQM